MQNRSICEAREHEELQSFPSHWDAQLWPESPEALISQSVGFLILLPGPPNHRQRHVPGAELLAELHQHKVERELRGASGQA